MLRKTQYPIASRPGGNRARSHSGLGLAWFRRQPRSSVRRQRKVSQIATNSPALANFLISIAQNGVARIEAVDIFAREQFMLGKDRRWHISLLKNVCGQLDQIPSVALGKKGDGSNQPSARAAQLAAGFRNRAQPHGRARFQAACLFKRPQSAKHAGIVDAGNQRLLRPASIEACCVPPRAFLQTRLAFPSERL